MTQYDIYLLHAIEEEISKWVGSQGPSPGDKFPSLATLNMHPEGPCVVWRLTRTGVLRHALQPTPTNSHQDRPSGTPCSKLSMGPVSASQGWNFTHLFICLFIHSFETEDNCSTELAWNTAERRGLLPPPPRAVMTSMCYQAWQHSPHVAGSRPPKLGGQGGPAAPQPNPGSCPCRTAAG